MDDLINPLANDLKHCVSLTSKHPIMKRVNTNIYESSDPICRGHIPRPCLKIVCISTEKSNPRNLSVLSVLYTSPTECHLSKLEALGECRPPWPRQIINPILPNVNVLSLGSERLTPKVLDHYLHHDLVMLPLLFCFLLIYSS